MLCFHFLFFSWIRNDITVDVSNFQNLTRTPVLPRISVGLKGGCDASVLRACDRRWISLATMIFQTSDGQDRRHLVQIVVLFVFATGAVPVSPFLYYKMIQRITCLSTFRFYNIFSYVVCTFSFALRRFVPLASLLNTQVCTSGFAFKYAGLHLWLRF